MLGSGARPESSPPLNPPPLLPPKRKVSSSPRPAELRPRLLLLLFRSRLVLRGLADDASGGDGGELAAPPPAGDGDRRSRLALRDRAPVEW